MCPRYLKLMEKHVFCRRGRLILYSDGLTVGNTLNHSSPRATYCIYWSFLGLPTWAFSRGLGWLLFGVIDAAEVKEMQWEVSGLMVHVLKEFFGKNKNFARLGLRVERSDGGTVVFQCDLVAFLQDFLAFQQILKYRGAGGTLFCPRCMNVTQNWDVENSDFFKDLSAATPPSFVANSQEHVENCQQKMYREMPTASKGDQEKLQQFLGLCYAPGSLSWDEDLKPYLDPVRTVWIDWYHVLLTSGGLGQHVGNEFVRILTTTTSITLGNLDVFINAVVFPKHTSQPNHTLEYNFNPKPNSPWRLFAMTTYQTLVCLKAYCDLVLAPLDREDLREPCRVFLLLCTIVDIFMLKDETLNLVDRLRAVTLDFFHAAPKVFPSVVRPKLHLIFHCIQALVDMLFPTD